MTGRYRALAAEAARVLEENDRGRFTVPAGHLYPHQWAWDAAFIALGWIHVGGRGPARALDELECLFEGQWADGRVPHIVFRTDDPGYFPGPPRWAAEGEAPLGSSSITNPPVWALALRRLVERGADRARVRALVEPMARSLRFFVEARDPRELGLVCVAHPWESGLDNSPAWDRGLATVAPERARPFERVDKGKVDDPAQRPTDDDYKRYIALVEEIAARGYGRGSFGVYCPQMSALFAWSARALAEVADELSSTALAKEMRGLAARTTRALSVELWSEEAGRFALLDASSGERSTPDLLLSHAPVWLPELDDTVRTRLQAALDERYAVPWPLPSVPPSSPAFDGSRYWRGPTWVNINWLFATAPTTSGAGLTERTLALLEREGFREYFHPETGAGLGARRFSWSAALALDLIARLDEG